MSDNAHKQIRNDFSDAVNMTPAELEKWLKTEDSQSVGWAGGEPKSEPGGNESVGHHSGERILQIKRKTVADLDEDDYAWMKKVIGYVKRHTAQAGPKDDKAHSRWRYSLMNWGHDPQK